MNPHETARLRALAFSVAYRVLGDPVEAEDMAHQAIEGWLQKGNAVEDPSAFVATLAARSSLTYLRNTATRRRILETYGLPIPTALENEAADARLDLSYGMLVLSFSLSPLARAVFVLREAFDLSFDEIGRSLDRSPATCRKLLSRARRTLAQAAPVGIEQSDEVRPLVRLMEAISSGNVRAVTELLTEDILLVSDGGGKAPAFGRPVSGRERIAWFLAVSPKLLPEPLQTDVRETPVGTMMMIHADGRLSLCVLADRTGDRFRRLYALSDPDKLARVGQEDRRPPLGRKPAVENRALAGRR